MHGPTFCNKDPPVVSLQCHNKTFDVDEAMNRRTDSKIAYAQEIDVLKIWS